MLLVASISAMPWQKVALSFATQFQLLKTLKKKALENTVGKEENAGNQHFLLFPQCFQLLSQREIVILATFNLSTANAFDLVMSKNLSFGKGLKSQWWPTRKVFVCKIQVNPVHTILKYGNYYEFMDR